MAATTLAGGDPALWAGVTGAASAACLGLAALEALVRNLLGTELPQRIADLLRTAGVPPSAIVLEVTESVLLSDPERSLAVVAALAPSARPSASTTSAPATPR